MNIPEWSTAAVAWLEDHEGLGTWLASFATLGAVIVSLWLAGRERRVRVRVRADAFLSLGGPAGVQRKLIINVVNHGWHPVSIAFYGFELWPRRNRMTVPGIGWQGPPLPTRLEYGQEAAYSAPLDLWIEHMLKETASTKWKVRRLRVHVRTTLGYIECSRIGARARRELLDKLKYGAGPRPMRWPDGTRFRLSSFVIGGFPRIRKK